MAWRRRRHFVPLVKLLRPELAAIPHTFGDALVRQQFWSMFSRPGADPSLRRRRRRRGVPPHLPLGERPRRLPRRSAPHLPRGAEGPEGLLHPPPGARAPGAVRLGRRGPARPAGLLALRPRRAARAPSRWCSSSAGTCRRWSIRSTRTRSSTTSSDMPRPPPPSGRRSASGRAARRLQVRINGTGALNGAAKAREPSSARTRPRAAAGALRPAPAGRRGIPARSRDSSTHST